MQIDGLKAGVGHRQRRLQAPTTPRANLRVVRLFLMRMNGIDEDGTWTDFLDDVEAILARLAG